VITVPGSITTPFSRLEGVVIEPGTVITGW
jgi:hypothetical protein